MDPLTHFALGAVCAAAANGPRHLRIAVATGAVGALLPDADVLIRSGEDALLVLEWHRQFSHSLLFVPFGALLVAGAVHLVNRRRAPFARLYLAACLGVASASLLDAATSYGTQLLWPFSDRRIAWNAISVLDPALTLPLLALAFLSWKRVRRSPAVAALAFSAVYLSVGFVQHHRVSLVQSQLAAARGHEIAGSERVVKPTIANLVLWRSVYRTGDGYFVDAIRLPLFVARSRATVAEGGTLPPLEEDPGFSPPPDGSRLASDLERFRSLSEGYLVRHPDQPDVVGDLRYAMFPDSLEPLWGIRFDPERPEEAVRFETFRDASKEARKRFGSLLFGSSPRLTPLQRGAASAYSR